MNSSSVLRPLLGALVFGLVAPAHAAPPADPWARDQIQAWCIVPYDAKNRTPAERARMLLDLKVRAYAYDFRPVHVPTFDEEVETMKKNGIAITAWWFPTQLNDMAKTIFGVIDRHGIKPELWIMGTGALARNATEQAQRVADETKRLGPLADAAKSRGLRVLLYNHGGWFGDPENQVQVVQALRREGFNNVGIVYNFHHAHDHIRHFEKIWPRISDYVEAVNLSGMVPDGDRKNQKILYLGEGTEELAMIRTIRNSGWRGRVGILSHRTEFDAAETLGKNLAGYEKLMAALAAEPREADRAPKGAKAGRK